MSRICALLRSASLRLGSITPLVLSMPARTLLAAPRLAAPLQKRECASRAASGSNSFASWLRSSAIYPGWRVPAGLFLTKPPFAPLIPDLEKPIWKLHATMRAALPHLALLHAAFAFSFAATFSNDMLAVRGNLIGMALCLFTFHFMFPEPVLVRIGWTIALTIMHLRMFVLLARDRDALRYDVTLSAADEAIFAESFQPFGFMRPMFHEIRQHAVRKVYQPGEHIFTQGSAMETIDFKLSGTFEMLRDGKAVVVHKHPQRKLWLGELWDAKWDPEVPHFHNRGLVTTTLLQSAFEVSLLGPQRSPEEANKACTSCLNLVSAPSREGTVSRSI